MGRAERRTRRQPPWVLVACAALSSACDEARGPVHPEFTRSELLDAESCRGCHPSHYREWASSMHAYASSDPIFVAMNRRGQRETGGELGSFCVKCHAPMAVREGATEDGLDLETVSPSLQGVTCFFCHSAEGVGDPFNGDVVLASDSVLRAGIAHPVAPLVHRAGYSPHHDRNRPESSALCGACHDVMTPKGVHLERTLAEYQESLFADPESGGFETCQGCHMDGVPGRAALAAGAPERTVHEHLFAGVDLALSDAPDREAQRRAVECALATGTRIVSVDHDGFGGFTVRVETSAGHHQPSGAAQDRRLWLEFVAYDAEGAVVFESGAIADGELEEKPPGAPGHDPQLFLLRDYTFGAGGEPVHQFWDAAPSEQYPDGRRSLVLPAALAPGTAHFLAATFRVPPAGVARVTARLRLRAIGRDVLEDLVSSGDLARHVADAVPTLTLHGASVEWTGSNPAELRSLWPDDLACPTAYRCLLAPDSPACGGTSNRP